MLDTSSQPFVVAPQAREVDTMEHSPAYQLSPGEIQNIHKTIAELGRGYQPQFVEMVSSNAYNTVIKCLEKAGIADQVIELLGISITLQQHAADLRAGTISDISATDIVDTLPQATRLIWDLGGEFADGESAWSKD